MIAEVPAGAPALPDPADPTVGHAAASWTVDIGAADSETYLVRVVVEGRYADVGEWYTVTVSKAYDNAILGGGYVVNQRSGGSLAGDAGRRTNSGFNARYTRRNPQGKMTLVFRRLENDGIVHTYLAKSNAILSLGTNKVAGIGMFESKGRIQDITDPLYPMSIAGNVRMQIQVTDRGEPGSADTIAATLWASDGRLLFSSNWDSAITREQLLAGGNVQVR